MIRRKTGIILTAFLTLIFFTGCSQSPDSNAVKNDNTNLSANVSNSNSINTSVNTSNISGMNNNALNGNSISTTNKNPVSKVPAPTPKIGSGADDLLILMQARGKLSSDKDLINRVIIEVKEGNATLTGKVLNDEQKNKAEQLVKSSQGIKSVKNSLIVSP